MSSLSDWVTWLVCVPFYVRPTHLPIFLVACIFLCWNFYLSIGLWNYGMCPLADHIITAMERKLIWNKYWWPSHTSTVVLICYQGATDYQCLLVYVMMRLVYQNMNIRDKPGTMKSINSSSRESTIGMLSPVFTWYVHLPSNSAQLAMKVNCKSSAIQKSMHKPCSFLAPH